MQERLPITFELDPKQFDYVLNVVTIEDSLHWHLHPAEHNYRQTVLLTQPSNKGVSTAVHKLQEALDVVGYKLSCEQTALDLGNVPT